LTGQRLTHSFSSIAVGRPIPAALGFDCWTSTANTTILAAITAFIDELWKFRTYLLGIRELGEVHNADAMSSALVEIMRCFPGLRFWATISDTTAVNPATAACLQLTYSKCQIHVLQRSIMTTVYTELARPLDHIDAVINYFKTPPCAAAALRREIGQLRAAGRLSVGSNVSKLVEMNKTRWTSTKDAVVRVNLLVEPINTVDIARDKPNLLIRPDHAQDLNEIAKLLMPLADITKHLEARERLMCEVLGVLVAGIQIAQELDLQRQRAAAARDAFVRDLLARLYQDDTLTNLMLFALFDPRYKALQFVNALPVSLPSRHREQWQRAAAAACERLNAEYKHIPSPFKKT